MAPKNLSKGNKIGRDQSRNIVNTCRLQAGGLLPTVCCYIRKIEVNDIITFLPTDP